MCAAGHSDAGASNPPVFETSPRFSYWQLESQFKHPLLVEKERELKELHAHIIMQRAATAFLIRLRKREGSRGTERSTSVTMRSIRVDDSTVASTSNAASLVQWQQFVTARTDLRKRLEPTTVVFEPMDCLFGLLLRKLNPSHPSWNDRQVKRLLRLMIAKKKGRRRRTAPTIVAVVFVGTQLWIWLNVAIIFRWLAPASDDGTDIGSGPPALRACGVATSVWAVVAFVTAAPIMILWILTMNLPLLTRSALGPEGLYIWYNAIRFLVLYHATFDESCVVWKAVLTPAFVMIVFLWNNIDSVQVGVLSRAYVGAFLFTLWSFFAYSIIYNPSLGGHKEITWSLEAGETITLNVLDHELSALTTLLLFVAKDIVAVLRRPKTCKALVRRVRKKWAGEERNDPTARTVAARFMNLINEP